MHYDDMEVEWPEWEFDVDCILDDLDVEDRQDENVIAYVKEVEAVVERLFRTEEHLFDVDKKEGQAPYVSSWSLTGKILKRIIENSDACQFSGVRFINSHPYVKVYHDAVEAFGLHRLSGTDPYDQADKLNAAVAAIRRGCRGSVMKQHMRKLEKAKQARLQGAQKLVKNLREKHARLEVLRVDLSYRKGKYIDLDDFKAALADVKADWERLRRDLLRGVPIQGTVGYMAKLEYGVLSGFHFHIVVLCDGSKHREDITLAKLLGEHWKTKIVSDGDGRYYNCNRHKNNYRYLGIGTLNHYDDAKYSALIGLVVDYMVKPDYIMATEAPGERTWFRSAYKPISPARRRGRPRSATAPYS